MNREITFRGKRIDNNEWIYGHYSTSFEEGDNGGIECYYRETCVELHYINNILVYPETVGQYIGIKDKSKEIAEDLTGCEGHSKKRESKKGEAYCNDCGASVQKSRSFNIGGKWLCFDCC